MQSECGFADRVSSNLDDEVLAANRTAVRPRGSASPALRIVYRFVGNGLQGSVVEVDDLRRRAFVITKRVGDYVEQDGFDGASAWARDRSGGTTTQGGGDMRALAINQAYRAANAWWQPDHGSAVITFLGRRADNGGSADVLRVAPRAGLPFDAWFDTRSHLLTRVDERRHGQATTVRYSDYRKFGGALLAGRISTGTEDPADLEVQTLVQADALASAPPDCCANPPAMPSKLPPAIGRLP